MNAPKQANWSLAAAGHPLARLLLRRPGA